VVDGIGNRGRYRYDGQLFETLYAERARFLVELTEELDVECRDVGIGSVTLKSALLTR
jgi:hypothetical protein